MCRPDPIIMNSRFKRTGSISAGILILYILIQFSFSVKRSYDRKRAGNAAIRRRM
jgi:hypothetical protein